MLVNNAGTDRFAFFVNTDEELWDFVLGVNLRGTIAVTHAVLPACRSAAAARSSTSPREAGRVGSQGSAVYSAAKAGVIGFTRAIARESLALRRARQRGRAGADRHAAAQRRAGASSARSASASRQGMIDATSMRRIGQPEEVAAAIAFLASDDALVRDRADDQRLRRPLDGLAGFHFPASRVR